MNQFGRFAALVCAAMVVLLTGCTKKENVPVTGVSVVPSTLTLGIGESQTLTADVQPADATNKGVTWSSDDPSMNVIALSGSTVKGLAEGTATVTVTTDDGGRTATCKITVSGSKISVQSVSISPSGSASLSAGETLTVTATVTPSNATEANNIYWTSSDTKVATVSGSSASATVTAVAAGSATITCSVDGKTATLSVTVTGGGTNPPAQTAPDGTVDMGLPSGIFWCTENLGTDAENPDGQKYSWDDHFEDYDYTKYNTTDGLTLLEAEDDRATQALGENYRTPTLSDFVELINNCTLETTKQGEIDGVLFTSKKNGNTIFFSNSFFWTTTLDFYYSIVLGHYCYDNAWCFGFSSENKELRPRYTNNDRSTSTCKIRAVYAKRPVIATGVNASKDKVEIGRGETVKLTASVQPSSANQQVLWFMDYEFYTATVDCYTGEVSLKGFGNTVRYAYAVEGVNGLTAETFIYPKYPSTQPEAVDLGLPSGTKWASCDLGSYAPEEPGFYYAWGETDQKFGYFANSTKWIHYNEGSPSFEKYDQNNRILELEDDAAAVHLGGGWQIPSREQVQELINKTTMVETTLNGVKGRLVTGPNLKTIFLPYGGYECDQNLVSGTGKDFHYQINEIENSSKPLNSYSFVNGEIDVDSSRRIGKCIRPVLPKQ